MHSCIVPLDTFLIVIGLGHLMTPIDASSERKKLNLKQERASRTIIASDTMSVVSLSGTMIWAVTSEQHMSKGKLFFTVIGRTI